MPPLLLTRRTWAGWLVAAAALGWAMFVAVRFHHLDDRVSRWWHGHAPGDAWNRPQRRAHSIWLPDYRFDIEGREIDAIDDNLSGLDYDADRGELLAVVNRPAELLVLDEEGRVRRRHPIAGASDVEALAYLGNGQVALLQEGRRSVAVAALPARDGVPIRVDEADAVALDIGERGNNGPEGMAYDRATDTLYVAKERAPVGLYAFQGLRTRQGRVERTDLSRWLRALPSATDLSSVEFDRVTRHLLLLSDEAQLLAEMDLRGEPVSWLSLRGPGRREWPMPQPEGVTIDGAGNLYIVSEPNLFYRLRRASAR